MPAQISAMLEPVRGHSMAKGALEAAIWMRAKQKGVPLAKPAGRGARRDCLRRFCRNQGVAGRTGCSSEKGACRGFTSALRSKSSRAKTWSWLKRLRQDFPRIKLMVDANSSYRASDWPLLQAA